MKFKKEDWNIAVQRAYDKYKQAKKRYNDDSHEYKDLSEEVEDEERNMQGCVHDFILKELEEVVDGNKFNDFQIIGESFDRGPLGYQYNYNIICSAIGDDNKPYLCYSIDLEYADWDEVDEIYESLIID